MYNATDILIRETSNGTTVWVSQRLVVGLCEVNEEHLRTVCRIRYKQSLPISWQKVADQDEFFLGLKQGRSWRWGRRNGQYYYDIDTIPNRAPAYYRDRLPSKDELTALVDSNNLRGSRERQAEQRRQITEQVQRLVDNTDIAYFETYTIGGKRILNAEKSRQLAESVAWCRFMRRAIVTDEYSLCGSRVRSKCLCA